MRVRHKLPFNQLAPALPRMQAHVVLGQRPQGKITSIVQDSYGATLAGPIIKNMLLVCVDTQAFPPRIRQM
jgi:hypothetical protein